MRPTLFGYLRTELVGSHIAEVHEMMREFADGEGLVLGIVRHEEGANTTELWQLRHDLLRAGSRHVITPTPTHMEGGGSPERIKQVRQLIGIPGVQVWYLSPNENVAMVRHLRRNRDIPAPHARQVSDSRSVVGHFTLGVNLAARGIVQLEVHEKLTRAGLRHLCAPAEQVIQAVLDEVAAAAQPQIYARVAAGYPDLAPLELEVWLLRGQAWLEIQIHEQGDRTADPVSAGVAAVGEHGRCKSTVGGTLTWARLPLTVSPSVSLSTATTMRGAF
ncbi:hypothetical protein IU438_08190 [Nocardia cyriacigeorgica]|nr:hypothetical protein [Nocardia cyriacigeorgica]MBF6089454.1 hypothetical protein [Nocardia cyriacigeorgica]MBF6094590.1 hypothetical protein [Nocardia cyriacigeorgica]MBF6101752.1 hypothetical protein [Nocardia cyriacigeorgica]MBF6158839.1 hypothetical protein [Nocardia cyriacigeorgica]